MISSRKSQIEHPLWGLLGARIIWSCTEMTNPICIEALSREPYWYHEVLQHASYKDRALGLGDNRQDRWNVWCCFAYRFLIKKLLDWEEFLIAVISTLSLDQFLSIIFSTLNISLKWPNDNTCTQYKLGFINLNRSKSLEIIPSIDFRLVKLYDNKRES